MKHKNLQELVSWILHLERRYEVETWVIHGIPIWNIIRVRLYMDYFRSVYVQKEQSTARIRNRIIDLTRDVVCLIKTLIRTDKKVDIIFSGGNNHRILQMGSYLNRFFDPLIDFAETERNLNCLVMEYQSSGLAYSNYYRSERVIEIHRIASVFYTVRKKLSLFKQAEGAIKLNGYANFLDEISNVGFNLKKHDVQFYKAEINKIINYRDVYKFFFKKFKPKVVIGLCYHINPIYGMNLAANELGIKSVDMQHGAQGDLHLAYGSFTKIPLSGYPTMPKVFWCWDDHSKNSIVEWSKNNTMYSAFNWGNTWLDFQMRQPFNISTNISDEIILVTLQPLGHLIDPLILNAIKMSVNRFNWWIRVHPRQMDRIEDIKQLLSENNLQDKVELDKATKFPLFALLRKSLVHVTHSSAVVLEAQLLNVPSIVTNEMGTMLYGQLIESNRVSAVLTNPSDLLDQIYRFLLGRGKGFEVTQVNDWNVVFDNLIFKQK